MCISPIYLTDRRENVPCGKCYDCLRDRANGWAFRIMQEYKQTTLGLFITLTYDTHNVPITKKGLMSLKKRDLQLYFKKLRKAGLVFKYYGVGEYGSKRMRPHYHVLFMFQDVVNRVKTENIIVRKWELGDVHIGELTEASSQYTLKYINKGKQIPKFLGDDRQQEKALMSKNLGINYINSKTKKWHKNILNNRYYLPNNEFKVKMIRYYKEKLYTKLEIDKIKKFYEIKHNEEIVNLTPQERIKHFKQQNLTQVAKWQKQQKHKKSNTGKL